MSADALYTAAAVRAIEQRAAALGHDADTLMARAGQAAWQVLQTRWPRARHLAVLCGPGNNGGDGYVLARLARAAGRAVEVMALAPPPEGSPAARALAALQAAGGQAGTFDAAALGRAEVIVDALFGTGLNRPLTGVAAAAVTACNASGRPVLALDLPSGLDADRGVPLGVAVRASATLSFMVHKPGALTGAGPEYCGVLQLADLAVPDAAFEGVTPAARLLSAADLRRALPPRRRDAHKGDCGHVLLLGGEHGYGGAILLAARGALRAGAGLVSVATRAAHLPGLLAAQPEVMAHAADDATSLEALIARADVLLVGPGLGQGDWGRRLFGQALESGKPLVLDADALNLLAQAPRRRDDWVLTPHPGEAARLLGRHRAQVQQDRFAALHELLERYGGVVLLKGVGTLIGSAGRTPALCAAGNPGMASGGMGDVLGGVVAALLAQGLPAFEAAACGALLHAQAADAAAAEGGERGLLASDLLSHLRRLANPV